MPTPPLPLRAFQLHIVGAPSLEQIEGWWIIQDADGANGKVGIDCLEGAIRDVPIAVLKEKNLCAPF